MHTLDRSRDALGGFRESRSRLGKPGRSFRPHLCVSTAENRPSFEIAVKCLRGRVVSALRARTLM